MLHFADLVKIEIILVIEQETPPLYLWQSGNRFKEHFIPFFFHHSFIKRFRNTQRPSVKRFVPYLVKLPVPLVPLLKVPVPPFHLSKFKKEFLGHFQFVVFPLPVLKANKIPFCRFPWIPPEACMSLPRMPFPFLLLKSGREFSLPTR